MTQSELQSVSLKALSDALSQEGIGNVDPVAFAYTQGLIKRVTLRGSQALSATQNKARESAQAYLVNVEKAAAHAHELIGRLSSADADTQADAHSLLNAYRFKQLERLVTRYEAKRLLSE